jgi:DNA-binding transcriptional MerR regulator
MTDMPIGEISQRSQVKVPTIRYYEQIGLLPAAARSDSNRRLYGARDLRRLSFIRHARNLGFEIDAIRTLLTLQDNPSQPCAEADGIARDKLAEVNARIESLMALKEELEAMVGGCEHRCVGECRVIEVLADHHKCLHVEH